MLSQEGTVIFLQHESTYVITYVCWVKPVDSRNASNNQDDQNISIKNKTSVFANESKSENDSETSMQNTNTTKSCVCNTSNSSSVSSSTENPSFVIHPINLSIANVSPENMNGQTPCTDFDK